MKILITGNLGYIGPVVAGHFRGVRPDAVLVGLDIGYFAHDTAAETDRREGGVDAQLFADVRRVPGEALRGVDAVVHLAAISNDPIGNRFEDATLDINHRATVDLAGKAKAAGVASFVFASSCSIYGLAEDRPRTEASPLNPLTAYARSKVQAERDLAPLAGGGFTVTALRFSTACGWSERLRLDLVLNDFVAGAVAAGEISILSDGTPWRPLIDVKDMARAFDWAVSRPVLPGSEFVAVNVGSNDANYRVRDLAEAVAAEIPGTRVRINPNAPPDKRSYRVNFDLYGRLAPNHQPSVGLRESIRQLRAGLASISFRDTDFRNSRFMRLNVLTELRKNGLLDDQLQWTRS
jgi:nucleoside-diphosphate-sugar epimerase